MGISEECGVEQWTIYKKSVDTPKFLLYLQKVRTANGERPIGLFMDNLSAHTSERSKQAMRDRGFRWIYNLPYMPVYNPIELSFSMVKRNFRSLRA